jgi:hypothetical protein
MSYVMMTPTWPRHFALKQRGDSDPHAGTVEVDSQYKDTLTIHGREFQKYSIDHSIHFMPVDEAS